MIFPIFLWHFRYLLIFTTEIKTYSKFWHCFTFILFIFVKDFFIFKNWRNQSKATKTKRICWNNFFVSIWMILGQLIFLLVRLLAFVCLHHFLHRWSAEFRDLPNAQAKTNMDDHIEQRNILFWKWRKFSNETKIYTCKNDYKKWIVVVVVNYSCFVNGHFEIWCFLFSNCLNFVFHFFLFISSSLVVFQSWVHHHHHHQYRRSFHFTLSRNCSDFFLLFSFTDFYCCQYNNDDII